MAQRELAAHKSEQSRRATPIRLAYLVSHPIQYQAPLLRLIAADPRIELEVFFANGGPGSDFWDVGFKRVVEWDVPLLDGYDHDFLPKLDHLLPRRWREKQPAWSLWRPINYGLFRRLRKGNFDALWVHGYARAHNWVAMVEARALGIKVLMRDDATGISPSRNRAYKFVKRLVFRLAGQLMDGVLPICTPAIDYYRDLGVPDSKIFMMPYTVDNEYFQRKCDEAAECREEFRRSLGLEPGRPVVLFAGKFQQRKRAIDLIGAVIALQSTTLPVQLQPYLLLAGDGELRPQLEAAAAKTGNDSIRFLGFQNQSALPALYDLADIFVLPAEGEDFGVVVNEAMNARCAVIVTDKVNSGPDLIQEGRNGYIYPVGDVTALTTTLSTLLADPALCRSMGETSREIINGWGLPEDVAVLKEALDAILAGKRNSGTL